MTTTDEPSSNATDTDTGTDPDSIHRTDADAAAMMTSPPLPTTSNAEIKDKIFDQEAPLVAATGEATSTAAAATKQQELPLPLPFHEEQDDDKFSDVFQGDLIDVTKNFMDRFSVHTPHHYFATTNGGMENINSIISPGEKDVKTDANVNDVVELMPATIHTDDTVEMNSILSVDTEKEACVKQAEVECNDDDLSLDVGEDASLSHSLNQPSTLRSSVSSNEPGTIHCNNGIPSSPSSEKRRERRKLRQSPPREGQLSYDATAPNSFGGEESSTTTTTTVHGKDIPTSYNDRFEISSVGSCVKIRERRKKILLDQSIQPQHHHHQSESNLPNSTTALTEKQVTGVIVGAGVVGFSHKSYPSPPKNCDEVLPIKTTSPELQIALMKRRQKIVERVGKNKVPIAKKAWLQTGASLDSKPASSPSSDIDTVPSIAAAYTEDGCGGEPKTPSSTMKKGATSDTVGSSPTTPTSGVGSTSLPSQQLIVTPSNELGINAADEEEEDTEGIMTPILTPSNMERNKARSQRRQLRNHVGVEMKPEEVDTAENIQEITPLTNPGSPSSLEKHKARSQRRQLRKRQGTNDNEEERIVLGKAIIPPNEMSEMEGCAVGVEEAKALFPDEESLAISSAQLNGDNIPIDSAWNVNCTSEMNSMLEKSKTENVVKMDDVRPLLQLDTVTSSEIDGETSLECASAKLLSQQDRMRMYNSGVFGVGDDSSVDDDENDEEEEETENLNSKYDSGDDADGDNFGVEVFEYEEMNNIHDDEGDFDQVDADNLSSLQLQPPNGDDMPTLTFSTSRALRWDQNPDAMSEAETESDFFDTTSRATTDVRRVLPMHCVQQMVRGKPTRHTPPPPQSSSSSFELDQDITPKIGPYSSAASDVRKERASAVELPKIPPPPPAKVLEWEQSKSRGLMMKPMAGQVYSPEKNLAPTLNDTDGSPKTPDVASTYAYVESHSPPDNLNLNYKIQRPKSPQKKKKHSHSLTEELDLAGHTRMAEKIVIATSKAARKFEEQYSHLANSGEEALDPCIAKGDNYFNAGGAPSKSSPHTGSPGTAVGELVGGAFSPWKIPDRAEDESSIASLARILQENESYARATAAAVKTILGRRSASEGKQDESINESFEVSLGDEEPGGSLTSVLRWLFSEVLPPNSPIVAAFSAFDINTSTTVQAARVRAIANDDTSFNLICKHVATSVMMRYKGKNNHPDNDTDTDRQLTDDGDSKDISILSESSTFISFEIPPSEGDVIDRPALDKLAASFVDFVQDISNLTGITSPYSDDCSFAIDQSSSKKLGFPQRDAKKTVQEFIFTNEDRTVAIFRFLRKASLALSGEGMGHVLSSIDEDNIVCNENDDTMPTPTRAPEFALSSCENRAKGHSTVRRSNRRKTSQQMSSTPITVNPLLIVPRESPSPFETAVWNQPSIVLSILSFLGNPVAVCAIKRLNVFCSRVVRENQHVLMRDAVRLGGMSKFVRPSFWLWVTEMCKVEDPIPLIQSRRGSETMRAPSSCTPITERNFLKLKDAGAHGKWHHVIERDVTRAFGNMPPHKTGARYRQDSIVRALVSFGREEIIRNSRSYQAMDKLPEGSEAKHFKLSSRLDCRDDSSNHSSGSVTPTDTVSDWGGISPVGSFISEDPSNNFNNEESIRVVSYESDEILDANVKPVKLNLSQHTSKSEVSDPVLSGNALTSDMKVDLQNKLRSILHALAARHEAVGYCQGMDYIVAHLLRVLQDTILLRVIQRSRAKDWRTISSDELRAKMSDLNTQSEVVEEVVFGVMDTFFSTYNLQHMYWPELRCLKTCCRVFEILIKQKLPVLADHFQHYDLNVGLFALGWFQTLFLYLPSMPSATVCHIWDIWLVERSFKIFFRIGTAILFLSQPTLLNNDLEGMMTYLNTFPDATLLRRDILIPCALQIKITNRMLVEIEMEVAKSNHFPSHNNNEYFPV